MKTAYERTARVISLAPRGPPSSNGTGAAEVVHNLEIAGQHVYHVGASGVLVHNGCGPGKWINDNHGNDISRHFQGQVTGRYGEQYQVGKVKFDGFDEASNSLLEAKGWGYKSLTENSSTAFSVADRLVAQAKRQSKAVRGMGIPIKWVFAEKEMVERVRHLFQKRGIRGINITHQP